MRIICALCACLISPRFPPVSQCRIHSVTLEASSGARRTRNRVDSESRFAIFLARILWKMRLASRENISASLASLTSLARRGKCDILSSLRVSQYVSLAFTRLTNKQSHNSQREISVRLKILARFSQDSRVEN
jgi:hypothetical protein